MWWKFSLTSVLSGVHGLRAWGKIEEAGRSL